MSGPASHSLVRRILWLHGIAVVISAIVVSSTVYLFLDSTADRLQSQTLRVHAAALADDLEIARDGSLRLRPDLASASLYAGESGLSFIIMDAGGRTLFRSSPPPAVPPQEIPRRARMASFRHQSRRAIYAGVSIPAAMGRYRLWVAAVQNLDHPDYIVDDIITEFLVYGVGIILPLLLVLLLVDLAIIRRALRPVVEASALVQRFDRPDPDVRLPVARLPAEVRPLVDAVNHAFDRLVASYRTQRDFTANAAHELRTPLTVLRMRMEAIPDPALAAALGADLDVLTRIVNQLLEIAEVDSAGSPLGRSADLHQLAMEAVAAIAPLAYAERRTLELIAPDGPILVRGDADLIVQALRALLENAVKHTRPETTVRVRVTAAGLLEVSDNGPGIAEADQPYVFQRFWRRNRGSSSNAGLGLAIVARVAEAHDSRCVLRSSPGAGASFSIPFQPA